MNAKFVDTSIGVEWDKSITPYKGQIVDRNKFWAAWEVSKDELKALGVFPSKSFTNNWTVSWNFVEPPKPDFSCITTLDLPELQPLSNSSGLLSYQIKHVQQLVRSLNTYNCATDISDTGTGKTYTAIATVRELNKKCLVIAPKTTIPNWKRVAQTLGVEPLGVVTYEKIRTGRTEWMSADLRTNTQIEMVVVDEAHRCKNPYTLASKMLIALRESNIPVLIQSATLVTSPLEMRAIGYALGLHRLVNFEKFLYQMRCERNRYGGWEYYGGVAVMNELHELLKQSGRLSRLAIRQLGDVFPKSRLIADVAQLEGSEVIAEAYVKASQIRETDYKCYLTDLLFARQKSELYKIMYIVNMTKRLLAEDKSVVIALNFSESIDIMKKKINGLGYKTSIIQGKQTAVQREHNIQLFQNDETRVCIINVKAGGVGVSLHDVNGTYPRYSIISPSYSAVELKQTFGRIWRANGTNSVQYIIFCADTIEEQMAANIQTKFDQMDTFNDGVGILTETESISPFDQLDLSEFDDPTILVNSSWW